MSPPNRGIGIGNPDGADAALPLKQHWQIETPKLTTLKNQPDAEDHERDSSQPLYHGGQLVCGNCPRPQTE